MLQCCSPLEIPGREIPIDAISEWSELAALSSLDFGQCTVFWIQLSRSFAI